MGLGVVGSILRAMFGYTSTPEWITLTLWLIYVVVVLYLYPGPVRPSEHAQREPRADAVGA